MPLGCLLPVPGTALAQVWGGRGQPLLGGVAAQAVQLLQKGPLCVALTGRVQRCQRSTSDELTLFCEALAA